MKNDDKKRAGILLILLVAYNLFVFIIFQESKTSIFWMAYFFTTIAIAVQCWQTLFGKYDKNESFIRMPEDMMWPIYLTVQLLLSIILMLNQQNISFNNAFLIQSMLLLLSIVTMLLLSRQRNHIKELNAKSKESVWCIQQMESDVRQIISLTDDISLINILQQLIDELHYSIPTSKCNLEEKNKLIRDRIVIIKNLIQKKEIVDAVQNSKQAINLVKERNEECKRSR